MRCIVLLGIGHTNAHVVREWINSPITDCRLKCISNYPTASYSGMLPGTLAGQFTPSEMQIDLVSLCARAGAELMLAQVNGLDAATRTLHFADAKSLRFDVLSIGVGSMPSGWNVVQSPSLVPIKPMNTFLNRLDDRLKLVRHQIDNDKVRFMRIAVVGGGVASIEIALCLQTRLRKQFNGFIATDAALKTTANLPIFSVGDSGTLIEHPSPKAGVYAVRQSPILWHNLQATLSGGELIPYVPQGDFLKLLNTGDGKALIQYKSLTCEAESFSQSDARELPTRIGRKEIAIRDSSVSRRRRA